jgi:hypothetical protein
VANIFKAKTLVGRTGIFSHEVIAPNLVYNTGDQNIDGIKNFYHTPTINGDGILSSGQDIIGGDLTGDLISATINKLQGYPLSINSPSPGQTLLWNGSTWVPGANANGGGGGGGKVYFFNFSNHTGIAPSGGLPTNAYSALSLLGRNYDVGSSSFTSPDLTPKDQFHLVTHFVTASGDPGVRNIPAGLWDFNIWANTNSTNVNQTQMKAVVNIYDPINSSYRYVSESDAVFLYDSTTPSQYILNVTMPQTGVQDYERIYVQLFGQKTTNPNRTITFYFDSYRPSHVHTTIPSVAGSGVVKVIDGVFQTPASTIVDIDVNASANIQQSKIQNLTTDLANLNSQCSVLTTNLISTGSILDNKINSLSGLFANYTGNLDATFATDIQLFTTGSTLDNKINSLSGYVSGISQGGSLPSTIVYTTGNQTISGTKTFANNLEIQGTGIFNALDLSNISEFSFSGTNINLINGNVNISGGTLYISGNAVLTGVNLNPYATTANLFATGSVLDNKINSLSGYVTGITGTFGTLPANLYSTGSILDNKINSLSGYVNSQDNIFSGQTFNTGSRLDNKINSLSGYVDSKSITLPTTIVYTTGNQTISGIKTFAENTIFGDSTQDDFLVISGNTFTIYGSGNFTSGLFVNGNAVLTGSNHTHLWSQLTYDSQLGFTNAGFAGRDSVGKLTLHAGNQNTNIPSFYGWDGFQNTSFTAATARTNLELTSTATAVENTFVRTTGNQTINGLKTFTSGIDIYSGTNPQSLRIFNSTGINSGEFGLIGWINNQFVIGPQQSQSGILRDVVITGNNININGSGVLNIFDNTNIIGNLNITGRVVAQTGIFGLNNNISGLWLTMAGGSGNIITANHSVIGGGQGNRVSGNFSFIGGGRGNCIPNNMYGATIGGGCLNLASYDATIGGGLGNRALGDKSFVGAGWQNFAPGNISSVAGGCGNYACSVGSSIAGGFFNAIGSSVALSDYSFIGGGSNNSVGDGSVAFLGCSVIAGGFNNKIVSSIASYASTIGGGHCNRICSAGCSIIGGGCQNCICSSFSTIGGGDCNCICASAPHSYIAGGRQSIIQQFHSGATVLGDGQSRLHNSSGAHTLTLDFASGVYFASPRIYGSLIFNSPVNAINGLTANSGVFSFQNARPSTLPNNPLSVVGSGNTYIQVNIQNRATGTTATADLVITANNGTDNSNFINLGINNSGYSDPAFTNGSGLDGYLFINGGSLDIGTQTANTHIDLHVGGTTASNITARFTTSGLDLNNSKLINATPDLLNVSENFNITGTQNGRVILANSPTIITGSIVSGNTIGFNTSIIQIGLGQVLITGIGSNVIVNSYNNQFRTAAQYATISILHTGNDGYIMYGNTST